MEVDHVLKACSTSLLLTGLPVLVVSCFLFAVLSRLPLDTASAISIALGGAISLSVLVLPFVLFFAQSVAGVAIWILLAGLLALSISLRPWNGRGHETSALPGFILLCSVIALTRLPFLHDLYFPLNADSAYHYQLISRILEPHSRLLSFSSFQSLTTGYYHYGFHNLVAFESEFTGLPINQLILLVGQLLQVLIPITLYPIGRWMTGTPWGGYVAMAEAAFGWWMPLRASTWGKYPALLGLQLFLLFLSLLIWMRTNADRIAPILKKYLLVTLSLIAVSSVLAHSRDIFLIGSVLFSIGMQKITQKSILRKYGTFLWSSSLLLALFLLRWFSSYDFQHIANMYLAGGAFSVVLIVFFVRFVRGASVVHAVEHAWFLTSLFFLLVIPMPLAPYLGRYFNSFLDRPLNFAQLIDRPFAEVIVFVPLTLLMALGIGGWFSALAVQAKPFLLKCTKISVVGSLILVGLSTYPLTPTCCQLLAPEDLQIIQWMQTELPRNSVVLISAVYSAGHRHYRTTDAGVWIQPLTRFRTVHWPYDYPFSDIGSRTLCSQNVTHVYAGADPYSFDKTQLSRSKYYTEEYRLGNVSVFRLDCRGGQSTGGNQ